MTHTREWTGMGQEIRTALISIRGSLALLGSGAAGPLPPAAKELLGIAARNCDRLVRLTTHVPDPDGAAPDHGGAADINTCAGRR